mgnify:CR=1 FL=1
MPGKLSQLPGILLPAALVLASFLLHCITAPVKKFRRYASLRIKARFTRNSKSKTLGLAYARKGKPHSIRYAHQSLNRRSQAR